jgi:hypothetical protein
MARNRKAGMDDAAAAARGDSPNPLSDPKKVVAAMPADQRPGAQKYGFTVQQTGPKSAKYQVKYPELEEGFIGPRRPESFTPRELQGEKRRALREATGLQNKRIREESERKAALVSKITNQTSDHDDRTVTIEDTVHPIGKPRITLGALNALHKHLSLRHAQLGAEIGKANNEELNRRWTNAQMHLDDAADSLASANKITNTWNEGESGMQKLQEEIGAKRPEGMRNAHLKDAMRMLVAAHNTLEHRDTRDIVAVTNGLPEGSFTPGQMTGVLPKAVDRLKKLVASYPSKNWTPRKFRNFRSGKVEFSEGEPVYEALTGPSGMSIIDALGKKTGISTRDLKQKVKQTKEGTPKSSRAGRTRTLAIDPKTGRPYTKKSGKKGRTVIADGVKAGELGVGATPKRKRETVSDRTGLSKNARPKKLQPYTTIGTKETEDDNENPVKGLTPQQLKENADAKNRGLPAPHTAKSEVTGLAVPDANELKEATKAYRKMRRTAARDTSATTKNTDSAATKRANAIPSGQRRNKRGR